MTSSAHCTECLHGKKNMAAAGAVADLSDYYYSLMVEILAVVEGQDQFFFFFF